MKWQCDAARGITLGPRVFLLDAACLAAQRARQRARQFGNRGE
jgi:hypothetical protein